MRRYAAIIGLTLLSAQNAAASDTTGVFFAVPLAGGIVGLVVALLVRLFFRGKPGRPPIGQTVLKWTAAAFGLTFVLMIVAMILAWAFDR